jgi:protein TonB
MNVRPPAGILLTLLLTGCGSAPPSHPAKGWIKIVDSLASPENCGLIHYVRPIYPKEAKRARIQGEVKLALVVTRTVEVSELHPVSGNPILVPAAMEAVRQWRYAPCRLNGEPVEVKGETVVPFTLNQ